MKRNVKILGILNVKDGESEKGAWRINDVKVSWQEQSGDNEPYEQIHIVSIRGYINETKLSVLMENGSTVQLQMYFGVRPWKEKEFNNVTGYLPKELMFESKEEAEANKPF